MPITLNNSNISVQYSSDKSYIIETVKSDLYLRNENVDTVIRNNIQTAPVTPTTFVDSSGNVYAVESYTYSGTANTKEYTRVFTKNTTCDILIVGGGGGGGCGIAGGGGGGQVVHATNINIPTGTYDIIVGSGGAGGVSNNGTNGSNSVAFGATANGGGGGGGTGSWGSSAAPGLSGGSGGGGGANNTNTVQSAGTVSFGSLGTILASAIRYGNAGGTGKYDTSFGGGGGGGGAGSIGTAGNSTSKGNGGNGIIINITGTSYYWGGGGGGAGWASSSGAGGGNGGLGGGGGGAFGGGSDTSGINGLGGINNNSIQPLNTTGGDGANNTGGGGGGGTYNANAGGKGGSGIVIIKYLLGTIPTTNFLTNEPIISPSTIITSNFAIFKHSGGAEAQTSYTYNIPQNTICDILIVGGGGAGGGRQGGGGGGGGVMFLENQQLASGNYTIKVGKGGILSGNSTDGSVNVIATNGNDSEFSSYIAYGGSGGAGYCNAKADFNITTNRFASGGGAMGWNNSTYIGYNNANERVNQTNISVQGGSSYKGGRGYQDPEGGDSSTLLTGFLGGGGGGAGGMGQDATPNDNTSYVGKAGNGGVGLNYGFLIGTGVGDNGWFGGGGGGAGAGISGDLIGTGGTGGGGNGNSGGVGVAGTNGTGGGGGAGGYANQVGGIGGSGIVIIRMRTSTAITPITEGLYKRLNLKYTPNYPEIASDKTTNLVAWYKFDEMSVDEGYLDSNPSNTKHNLTKPSGSTPIFSLTQNVSGTATSEQGTVSHLQFPTSLTDQLYAINDKNGITFSFWYNMNMSSATWGILWEFSQNSTDSANNNRFGCGKSDTNNAVLLNMKQPSDNYMGFVFGNGTLDDKWHHLSWSIASNGAWTVYLDGVNQNATQNRKIANNTYNTSTIFKHVYDSGVTYGYLDDFRIYNYVLSASEIATLCNINNFPKFDTYTLNFPVPTLTDINNNSNIVLQGAYDISLSTSNSVIIPKANQYIPKPTTFSTSNISLRYHLLNPVLDPIGAQWTYSSNNTNVYHMGSVGIGTTSPEYHLDVRGNIYSSTGGFTQSGLTTWSITSDRRIKENIVKASYDKCLENVKNIELYNFNFKDNYVNTNDRRQLGFIAQEVQQVYPKAVEVGKMIMKNNDGIENILSLNTTQIEYTLYGAVKKLIDNIEEMENEIAEIENTSNITTQA